MKRTHVSAGCSRPDVSRWRDNRLGMCLPNPKTRSVFRDCLLEFVQEKNVPRNVPRQTPMMPAMGMLSLPCLALPCLALSCLDNAGRLPSRWSGRCLHRARFVAGRVGVPALGRTHRNGAGKGVFVGNKRHFILGTDHLPRDARDKHTETLKKRRFRRRPVAGRCSVTSG